MKTAKQQRCSFRVERLLARVGPVRSSANPPPRLAPIGHALSPRLAVPDLTFSRAFNIQPSAYSRPCLY